MPSITGLPVLWIPSNLAVSTLCLRFVTEAMVTVFQLMKQFLVVEPSVF
jgi:hypothetical protein